MHRSDCPFGSQSLFQRRVDRIELGVEVRTQAVYHSDDRQRDAGCDQTIFNRGCPRLIRKELNQVAPHIRLPCGIEPKPFSANAIGAAF